MLQQIGRLGKNTLIYGMGQVLTRIISFLLLPIFTAYLTPTDYGISSILGLITFVAVPIFSLGFGSSLGICYFEGNNYQQKEVTIWTAFTIHLISTIILVACGTLFARQLSILAFGKADYDYLISISLWSSSFGILVTSPMSYLQFEEKAITFVTLIVVSSLISIGLNIIFVVVFKKGIQGLIESQMIGQFVSLSLFLIPSVSGGKYQLKWAIAKDLLRLGLPFVPSFVFIFVLFQANRYVLQWFSGLEMVGIYTIGFNLGAVISIIVSGFQNAWFPYFMSFINKKDEIGVLFGRILTYYVFGFGTLSLLFYIFAKPVIMMMTQPAFYEAYKVIGPSTSAYFLNGIFVILLPAMYFAKEVKFVSFIQLLAAIFAIILNLILIPFAKIQGAAIALVLGNLGVVVLTQVWNWYRGTIYLKIEYEWERIGQFSTFYILCVVLMLWERHVSLLFEVFFSLMMIIFLICVIFVLLKSNERRNLSKIIYQLVFSLFSRFSPIA